MSNSKKLQRTAKLNIANLPLAEVELKEEELLNVAGGRPMEVGTGWLCSAVNGACDRLTE